MLKGIRFDRNEFSGAFGDIGTDLPLIVGMILAAKLDSASVLIVYGLLQIFSALVYRIPMPVQPLKAVATLVIAGKLASGIIYGAGLAIGIVMVLLTVSGLLTWLARVIPHAVVRGIQFGLGVQLALLSLTNYIRADGVPGYILATAGFIVTILLIGNRKYPPALLLIGIGIVYAFVFKLDFAVFRSSIGLHAPTFYVPTTNDVVTGVLVLALPQIPPSIGNSILATQKIAADYFPERKITIRNIGLTYSFMNLAAPFLSGVPVCHGSGGMAGHYLFGARTGGSVIIYGSMYIVIGLLLSGGFASIIQVFPLPILGVILLFEGIALMRLMKDTVAEPRNLMVAFLVGLMAAGLPYGYLVGIIVGTALILLPRRGAASFTGE